jgi:uncharacterized protein DUF349
MGLLERLRPQPKWRHPDAAIRAAGIAEIPPEELDTLIDLARHDPDPRVRRACVDRLEDPRILAEIASQDSDPGVREAAVQALADTAIGAYDGASEPASLAALEGIADVRMLAEIAKRSAFEPVSRGAATRIEDPKVLASIARRSPHVATRIDALARVSDPDDLDAIASRTDFKDVALAALERIHDRARLESIAERAKNKAASRTARARLRDMDDADRARAAETEAQRAEARAAAIDVCARVEALSPDQGAERVREALTQAELDWSAVSDVGPDLAARYGRAVTSVRQAIDDAERARAARREREEALARALEARARVVEAAERLANDGAPDASGIADAVAALEREWEAQPAASGGAADDLAARFTRACRSALTSVERAQARATRRARLDALLTEAEALGLTDPAQPHEQPIGVRVARWKDLRREWVAAHEQGDVDADLAARFTALQAGIDAARARAREAREAREREQAERLRRDVERLERHAAAEPLALKAADRILRDVRTLLDQPSLAAGKEHADLGARLRAVQSTLAPRVKELRDLDEWQRWANVEVQEKLCARVEALKDSTDIEAIARELREVQERWRAAAAVPRQHAQVLWHRYKTAYDEAHARCETYFALQAEARAANLQRKEELCAQAEALSNSSDWIATADHLKALQAEWKTIGAVPRGREKAVWERFQKACDQFFTRRHEDLVRRKEMWAQNLARKEALCVRAEELAESSDWETAAAGIKGLQAEWKTIGPVKKTRSEAIWQRFRSACDRFFERYKHRHDAELHARLETREQLLAELESVAAEAAGGTASGTELASRVNSLHGRWLHAPPLPREHAAAAQERFTAALDRMLSEHAAAFAGTALDVRSNQRRLEQLCERVEKLAPADGPPAEVAASPAARLATMWRDALAANTIGGRVDEDAKWRAAVEDVREAQSAWNRVGYLPDATKRQLTQRFERAARKVMEQAQARRGSARK